MNSRHIMFDVNATQTKNTEKASPWYLKESQTLLMKSQNGHRYSNLNSRTKSARRTSAHTTRNFRYKNVRFKMCKVSGFKILQYSQNYSFQAVLHQKKMSWLNGFNFAVSPPSTSVEASLKFMMHIPTCLKNSVFISLFSSCLSLQYLSALTKQKPNDFPKQNLTDANHF